jgi:uncharacterized protein YdhG (YjbR/CyaY superfamily)
VKSARSKPGTIDEYIAAFPPEIQAILQKIRATIRKAAPEAEERIIYQIPTFALEGNLVHFAAFKNHIGFYPPVRADAKLAQELSVYAGEKGNLRFPLDQPIPYALITKIVKARIRENREQAEARRKKK